MKYFWMFDRREYQITSSVEPVLAGRPDPDYLGPFPDGAEIVRRYCRGPNVYSMAVRFVRS